MFPGLEAALDLKREGTLLAVTKLATPAAARRHDTTRLCRWLKGWGVRKAQDLAERIIEAKAQRWELPAAEAKAALVAEIASEMLRTRERIADLDRRLEELLADNPAAQIVRTMPGMGVVFTAEFLAEEVGDLGRFASADSLVAAAGVAPVLRASGATSYRRRARRGNRVLKRILYRSAFSCIFHHEQSGAFYRKKRAGDRATTRR